jgi:hypothetical protein
MFGNNSYGTVSLLILTIVDPSKLANSLYNRGEEVSVVKGALPLNHSSGALQAHPGVHILLRQGGALATPILIILGEHYIPNLKEAAAITFRGTGLLAAAVILTKIVMDFGAGSTGSLLPRRTPEVILLTIAHDALFGNTKLPPISKGLIII